MSGVFLIDGNISEGEYLDESWLKESRWKAGAIEGNSPVFKNPFVLLAIFLKYLEVRKP